MPKHGLYGKMTVMMNEAGFMSRPWAGKVNSIDLKLKDILRDHVYDFAFPSCPQRFAAIETKFPGLPLLIVDGETRLVWGHDYLRLLLGRGRIRAVVLQAELDPAAALLLNFNLSNRLFGLNLYEKLLFVRKISAYCPPMEIQRRVELDFSLNDLVLKNLDALLHHPLRPAIASGQLGLKAALKLIGFTAADQRALLRLYMNVRFSESHQLQVMQFLEEIAFREKKSLARILVSLRLTPVLALEMPQQKVIDALKRRRFPFFSQRQSAWCHWQQKNTVPGRVTLSHTPFFANEEVQLILTAKNTLEAEEMLRKLKLFSPSD